VLAFEPPEDEVPLPEPLLDPGDPFPHGREFEAEGVPAESPLDGPMMPKPASTHFVELEDAPNAWAPDATHNPLHNSPPTTIRRAENVASLFARL
jgi:hypothetical protein